MDLFAQKQNCWMQLHRFQGQLGCLRQRWVVNKPLQSWVGSALHSSPWQVLASASITHKVIRNCLLFEVLLSPEPQVTESWLYAPFIALLPPLNSSTGEQRYSWPQGRLLSLLEPFLQHSLNIFKTPFLNKKYIQQYNFEKRSKPDYKHPCSTLCFESTRVINMLVWCLHQTNNWEECTY